MNREEIKNECVRLSRGGICYDLKKSPFKLEVPYDGDVLTYMFSSESYKNKFYNGIVGNREKINESLSNRFGIKVINDILCDIKLYSSIEKRGFCILKGEGIIECQKDIILNGGKVMRRS